MALGCSAVLGLGFIVEEPRTSATEEAAETWRCGTQKDAVTKLRGEHTLMSAAAGQRRLPVLLCVNADIADMLRNADIADMLSSAGLPC